MKQELSLIILLVSLVSYYTPNALSAQNRLEEQQLLEDFSVFQSSLQHNHPQLYLYSSKEKLDSFLIDAKAKLESDLSPIEFYRVLSPILTLIRNNHTNISPPKQYIDYISSEAKRFPFSLYLSNDTLYVLEDASTEYSIKEGSIIISINDIKVSSMIATFLASITTDGYNETQPKYRAGRGFSRYLAYFYGFPEIYKIDYIDSAGSLRTAMIDAIPTKEIAKNRARQKVLNINDAEDYSFEVTGEVGILTVRTFAVSNPGSLKRFFRNTFEELHTRKTEKLLIDLRENLGGFPEASIELLSYLISETVSPYKLEYAITDNIHHEEYFEEDIYLKHYKGQKFIERDGKYFVKGAVDARVKASKYAYDKELYILMNANSSSTTGQLLGLIKTYTDAVFIGEESGGNPVGVVANDILTLILPHSKIEVKLPVIYSEVNVDFENTGRGVLPDQSMKPTVYDLLSGEDRVLKNALDWISGKE